jgi:hypothetical protein
MEHPNRVSGAQSLTDPDVQISRFRFFTGEPRSQWCNDGQFGLLAKGDALGAQCTGASGADSRKAYVFVRAVFRPRSNRLLTRGSARNAFPAC